MYVFRCDGSDLILQGHYLYDRQPYKHNEGPVYKARDANLFVYWEWVEQGHLSSQRPTKGRWVLGRAECPELAPSARPTVLAHADSDAWTPHGLQFMHPEGAITTVEEGRPVWAFGPDPHGSEAVDTCEAAEPQFLDRTKRRQQDKTDVPLEGWRGVRIVRPAGRRFVSCWTIDRRRHPVPVKLCVCHAEASAIFVEPFAEGNPEHVAHGKHKYMLCPDCFQAGDWCRSLLWKRSGVGVGLRQFMAGRQFRRTEAGLETHAEFEGGTVRVTVVPEPFLLPEAVWALGQEALHRSNNRDMFRKAHKLLLDQPPNNPTDPHDLADVMLLLNFVSAPRDKSFQEHKAEWAARAATSAVVFRALEADEHVQAQKLVAQVLRGILRVRHSSDPCPSLGWRRFPLSRKGEQGRQCSAGVLCYHGTAMTNLAAILACGLRTPTPADVAHGQRGARGRKTCLYFSPSVHYAAHPVYSPLHVLEPGCAVQMVFECRLIGQYRTQNGTLNNKHWDLELRMDPDWPSMEGLEYVVEEEGAVQLTAVMFRRFGKNADPSVYGELPRQLVVDTDDENAVQFQWTRLLQDSFRRLKLFSVPKPSP